MLEFVAKYWLEVGFGLLCAGFTAAYRYLLHQIKKRKAEEAAEKAEQDAIKKALVAVLHSILYEECVRIIERKEITDGELSNINYLYAGYAGLGGNGTGKELYERAKSQPITHHN